MGNAMRCTDAIQMIMGGEFLIGKKMPKLE